MSATNQWQRWTGHELTTIKSLYNAGYELKDIAAGVSRSEAQTYRKLLKLNLRMANQPVGDPTKGAVRGRPLTATEIQQREEQLQQARATLACVSWATPLPQTLQEMGK